MKGKCPECDADVPMPEHFEESEIVECPECSVELEIEKVEPLTLKVAPEEDEDWGE